MSFNAIILAAGQGKRMHSDLPKVAHEVMGRPMVLHVVDAIFEAAPDANVCVVVGHGRETVKELFSDIDVSFAIQEQQLGTGHAVAQALNSDWGKKINSKPILVLSGDTPLVSSEVLKTLTNASLGKSVARVMTTTVSDPTGYGRIVRSGKAFKKIVEQKDASLKEQAIREINVGLYLFDCKFLKENIVSLKNKNAQKELYLTDMVEIAVKKKKSVEAVSHAEARDLMGVNNPWELSIANQVMAQRINRRLAMGGVFFTDPGEVWIDVGVEVGAGTRIEPNVILYGKTKIGANVHLKAGTIIADSVVESGSVLGPYAHVRPGSHIGRNVKIGNFVEIKKSRIGEKTAISHLSYVGDAEVGARVNIGCGFVTCNYDGKNKHKTVIEDDVFMGSDCQTVAPLTVGRGAYVGSGSTLTKNVPADSLAIARSRQENKIGYASRFRKGKDV